MMFVKVRHDDGREAEITEDEVAYYRSMGFVPVAGSAVDRAGPPAVTNQVAPANGTDQRLDLILDELRGLRADLAGAKESAEPADGETIELREPEDPNVSAMTREELNAHAATIGIAEPETFPNKAELIEAIEAATRPPQN